MPPIRRILTLLGALVGIALYVWFAAVRALPAVKRRKAARRADRRLR
jgi:hypothetical protein